MNTLRETACRMSKVLALASVVVASLSYTHIAGAAQVTVSAVFDSYTGPYFTVGAPGTVPNINGVSFPAGTSVTNFGFTPGAQVDFYNGFEPPNQLKFTSSGPQLVAAVGDEFLIGVISYTNGNWYRGTSSFHVRFTTSSSTAAFNDQILDDSFTQMVTPNVAGQTPLQNADFLYFTNHPDLGSMRVFEAFDSLGNNTGTVNLYGKIGSLIPTRFADATGGATIVPSINANPVPEPSTYALLLAGLGILVMFGRRRSNGEALNAWR